MRLHPRIANRVAFVLSLLGAAVSLYLTLAHMNYLALTCGEIPGCAEVAAHPTARGFGIRGLEYIPTAAFGLGAFSLMAGLAFFRAIVTEGQAHAVARLVQRLMATTSVAACAYLTYLEAFVIRAWCQWCVATAVVAVLLFITLLLESTVPRRDIHS